MLICAEMAEQLADGVSLKPTLFTAGFWIASWISAHSTPLDKWTQKLDVPFESESQQGARL